MSKDLLKRSDYVASLEQLMTISCILAGFATSALIGLPGLEEKLYQNIVSFFSDANTDLIGTKISFYFLFISSMCFLSTIMTILVYKASGYLIPLSKLRRVHLISNLIFSLAIATLIISIIIFGIPTVFGFWCAITIGIGVAACFIWENMVPIQRKIRIKQIEKEMEEDKKKLSGKEEEAKEEKTEKKEEN